MIQRPWRGQAQTFLCSSAWLLHQENEDRTRDTGCVPCMERGRPGQNVTIGSQRAERSSQAPKTMDKGRSSERGQGGERAQAVRERESRMPRSGGWYGWLQHEGRIQSWKSGRLAGWQRTKGVGLISQDHLSCGVYNVYPEGNGTLKLSVYALVYLLT